MSFTHDRKFVESNGTNTVFWKYDQHGQVYVLVQKHPHRKFWEFSGGGVEHDEQYVWQEWNIFCQAAWREVLQELGIGTDPKLYVWEAAFQQRVKIEEGRFVTGTLYLFSYQFDETRWSTEKLKLQAEEVAEVRWVSLEDVILATEAEPMEDGLYLGRGYRIMAACFRARFQSRRYRHNNPPSLPWQGSLSKSFRFNMCDQDMII